MLPNITPDQRQGAERVLDALRRIRDRHLYKEEYPDFETFVRAEFGNEGWKMYQVIDDYYSSLS